MTDPASPAAVTEERIAFLRLCAERDQDATMLEIIAAYEARGLELARVREEAKELASLLSDRCYQLGQARAQSAGEALDPAGTGEGTLDAAELRLIRNRWHAGTLLGDEVGMLLAHVYAIEEVNAKQASALAGARRSALTQASELVMRRREAIRNGGARNVLMYLADEIRALTEPQHGNG